MIDLPDFKKSFEYENNFYLSCDITRISKILAQYELFKLVNQIPGAIVECGVLKGASFSRFATFREIFSNPFSKQIIGFDTFGDFPETSFQEDKQRRDLQIDVAGNQSISTEQLKEILKHKGVERNIELIEGDITKTVPKYVEENPRLKISLLNLDTDIYYPRITKGGILLLDDYETFPGEAKAVDDYFEDKNVEIKKFPFCLSPSYIIKK
ncbi:MAG: dTDP-6-deoxy-L-hexose 3-O-methyltransferase [Thaumarchaeota archaeon]|nr:MAG: dTDP-6-deoxy-L-hexose 3-O-methyltransferase [Nitrososphaerota archaeon]